MSVTDIQHASTYDASQNRATQAAMLTAFATFQTADQALTYLQQQGAGGANFPASGTSGIAQATTNRTSALAAFQTLAAALT